MLTIFQTRIHYLKAGESFFEGLHDDEKLVYDNLKGPSWSPAKIIKKPAINYKNNLDTADFLIRN